MKTRTVGFLCSMSLLTTLVAFAENVSGTWKGSYPGRDGQTRESTIVLKADGEKLEVTNQPLSLRPHQCCEILLPLSSAGQT